MAVIATAANPASPVSRVDIDRPGPTYTKDTLTDLRAAEPDAEWFFITGADALAAIMSWKDVDEVFAWRISSVSPGPATTLPRPAAARQSEEIVEVPALAISSTDCRYGSAAAPRSGIWFPTESSNTSPNMACTRGSRKSSGIAVISHASAAVPVRTGAQFSFESRIDAGRNMTATDTA
jgi:hypothetical protein